MGTLNYQKVTELPTTLVPNVLYMLNQRGQLNFALRDSVTASRIGYAARNICLSGKSYVQKADPAYPRTYDYRLLTPDWSRINKITGVTAFSRTVSAGSVTNVVTDLGQGEFAFTFRYTPPSSPQTVDFLIDRETSIITITDWQVQKPTLTIVSPSESDYRPYPVQFQLSAFAMTDQPGDPVQRSVMLEIFIDEPLAGRTYYQHTPGDGVTIVSLDSGHLTANTTYWATARYVTETGHSRRSDPVSFKTQP